MRKIYFKSFLVILFICLSCHSAFSQSISPAEQRQVDSLNLIINSATSHDTALASAYLGLSEILYVASLDTLLYLCEISKEIAEKNLLAKPSPPVKLSLQKSLAGALNNIGYVNGTKGNISKQLDYYKQALEINKEIENKEGIAICLNNIGSLYKRQGDIPEALENHFSSLKIQEEIGNKEGIANSLNNIAVIFEIQGDDQQAIEYYLKSLRIREELGYKQGIATSLNNIGHYYGAIGDTAKALEYFYRSLEIRKEIKNKKDIAISYGNIGGVYWDMGNIPKALNYYKLSLAIFEELSYKKGIANTLKNIGNIEFEMGEMGEAQKNALKSLTIAREIGFPEFIGSAANLLSMVYEKENKGLQALEMYRLHIIMRDSINNELTQKANAQQQAKFTYEKQKAIDDLAYEKQLAIEQEEKEKQQIFTIATAIVLALSIAFLYFILNRLKITRRQKNLIEKQKEEVEGQRDVIRHAHKEITDSITYAKRIQNAILPPARIVKEYLEDSFILYNPKDVVAGDFYWMRHIENKILFAAADCTGHGVPGAMVSVVCNNALNRSVRDYGLSDPGQILTKTREIVINEFEKSDDEVKDGMDIALCTLENHTLQYAGAYNPLWIIRNGELIEIKANRWPIGLSRDPQPFTTHTIRLEKNDVIYIFTDGFVDQFGGEFGKKYKSQKFKSLLLSIYDKPMVEQRNLITETFDSWKGKLEQVDDVCIIGARV